MSTTVQALTVDAACGCHVRFDWNTPEWDFLSRLHGTCRHTEWQLTLTLQPRPTRRFLADNVEDAA
jgi:hypothetical protein